MASLLTQVTVVPGTTVIFAGNESVMVHAHGCHRVGAGIVRILRQARAGRQNGEQDGQPQRTQNALRLAADP